MSFRFDDGSEFLESVTISACGGIRGYLEHRRNLGKGQFAIDLEAQDFALFFRQGRQAALKSRREIGIESDFGGGFLVTERSAWLLSRGKARHRMTKSREQISTQAFDFRNPSPRANDAQEYLLDRVFGVVAGS
jgi:hypothetical protein